MTDILIGMILGVTIAGIIGKRNEKIIQKRARALHITNYTGPVPVVHVQENTVKEWFAKLDEEVTEFKAAILALNLLDVSLRYDHKAPACYIKNVTMEGADICTVVASILYRMGISTGAMGKAQSAVNQHNLKRGRL